MKKKKTSSKKIEKQSVPVEKRNEVQVTLFNVLPFLIDRVAKIDRDLDKLQQTVDAIGVLLADHAIHKD